MLELVVMEVVDGGCGEVVVVLVLVWYELLRGGVGLYVPL